MDTFFQISVVEAITCIQGYLLGSSRLAHQARDSLSAFSTVVLYVVLVEIFSAATLLATVSYVFDVVLVEF